MEDEFKDQYLQLAGRTGSGDWGTGRVAKDKLPPAPAEQCKQYACDLLSQCRSTEEVMAVLNKEDNFCNEEVGKANEIDA